MLYGGFTKASPGEFITYRSNDAGDLVYSLTGFAILFYMLKEKYANVNNRDFDYDKLKCRWYGLFWGIFLIYSCYWFTFYWISLTSRNLVYIDCAMSAYFGFSIILLLYFGNKLTG